MHSLDTLMRTVSSVTGFHSNSASNMAITAAGKDLSLLYLPPYDAEKRIQALETKDLGKLVRISCLEHETNDWVRSMIHFLLGTQKPLLATVRRRKLAWFRYAKCHDRLSKTILQGTLEVGQRCGRRRKCWMDNIKEWTSLPMPELLTMASCRKDWKRVYTESSLMSTR